jgi:hypothetical protein
MSKRISGAEEAARIKREEHRLLEEIAAAQRKRRRKDKLSAQPSVGIVFLVGDHLFIDSTPLSDAGGYGHFKIHEADHYAYWDKLQAAGAVPASEYDDFPRGRVSYDTRTRKFSLFLDKCIIKKDFVQRIMKWMNLPKVNTKVETDPHYRCPVCLRGKRSFDED